jgi:hypothetical protein
MVFFSDILPGVAYRHIASPSPAYAMCPVSLERWSRRIDVGAAHQKDLT